MQSVPVSASVLEQKLASASLTGHVTLLRAIEVQSGSTHHATANHTSTSSVKRPPARTTAAAHHQPIQQPQQHHHHPTDSSPPLVQKETTVLLDTRLPPQQPPANANSARPGEHVERPSPAHSNPQPAGGVPLQHRPPPPTPPQPQHQSQLQPEPERQHAADQHSQARPAATPDQLARPSTKQQQHHSHPPPVPAPAALSAPAVPPAPLLDPDTAGQCTAAAAATGPTTPQLKQQLHGGLSTPETPTLNAVNIMFSKQEEQSKQQQQQQQQQSAAKTDTRSDVEEDASGSSSTAAPVSSAASSPAGHHLLDGVHIDLPRDSKEHKVTQAFTKTEVPLDDVNGQRAMEIRKVWEERVDDGEWTVVKEERVVVLDSSNTGDSSKEL